jgi:hypothetical protein
MKKINLKSIQKKASIKLTPANQVILAGIAVLVIFLAALLSSMPKKDVNNQTSTPTSSKEIRSGTQTVNVSIVKPGEPVPPGSTNTSADTESQSLTTDENITGLTVYGTGRAIAFPGRVKFAIDSFKKLAVQPLKFKVYSALGTQITPDDLQTMHEQKMHFYVVSANLREFQHLKPEYKDGSWSVSANLPSAGTYYAYIDITPVKGNPVVIRGTLTVREATKGTPAYPGITPNMLAIVNGYSAVLNNTIPALGTEGRLSYSLTKDSRNVSGLRPLYGAFGNVTIFRHTDPDAFVHAHQAANIDETKGIINFNTIIKKAGTYTAFGEFKVGDKIVTFPITFDIK